MSGAWEELTPVGMEQSWNGQTVGQANDRTSLPGFVPWLRNKGLGIGPATKCLWAS